MQRSIIMSLSDSLVVLAIDRVHSATQYSTYVRGMWKANQMSSVTSAMKNCFTTRSSFLMISISFLGW